MTQTPPPPPVPRYPAPPPPPPTMNGLGLGGFITSIVGMVFCLGLLCPIGAILSAIGLIKKPRGFAVAGLVLGVLGSLLWGLLAVLFFTSPPAWMKIDGLYQAQSDIDSFYITHSALPDDHVGQRLVDVHDDQWGTHYVYKKIDAQNYELISAGPDQVHGTGDDVVNTLQPPAWAQNPGGFGSGPFGGGTQSTDRAFDGARQAIDQAYGDDYESPTWHEVDRVLGDRFTDEWGNRLRYNAGDNNTYTLRSAGPDGAMDTDDDIARSYTLGEDGENELEPFMPNNAPGESAMRSMLEEIESLNQEEEQAAPEAGDVGGVDESGGTP